MNKKIITLFIGFVLSCFCADAQTYSYKHYTIFEGLIQNQVMRLFQDSKGFIWIATKVGISRFDGRSFKNYPNRDVANVQSFFEYNNTLFCCTNKGIYLFDEQKFNLVYRSNKYDLENLKFNVDKSELWIWGKKDIVVFSINGIKHINLSDYKPIYNVLPLINDKGYLITNDSGVYLSEYGKAVKKTSNHVGLLAYLGQTILLNEYYKNNRSIEVNGIFIIKNNAFKKMYNPDSNVINSIFVPTINNNILFVQNHTTWIKMDTLGTIIDKDSIPDVFINDIIQDNNGNFWIATETGLYYRQSAAFRNYDEKSGMPKYVWSIFEDNCDSSIVFATFPGELASLKKNRLTKIENYKKHLNPEDFFYMNGFCNSQGEWMIPGSRCLFVKRNNRLNKVYLKNNESEITTVFSCYEDIKTNMIYLGTTKGLYSYDIFSRKTQKCSTDERLVLSLEKDKYGRLWVCRGNGVLLYENNAFTPFKKNEIPMDKGVIACCKDFKGNMWFAGKDALFLYTYTQKYKISEGSFFFINQYKNRYIIAGTIKGFLWIDLEKLYAQKPNFAKFFDRFNGFIGVECGQNGTCVDSKGNIWIPTSESVVKFMPEKLTLDTVPPKTFLYSFETATSDLDWNNNSESTIEQKYIKFNWDRNNVRITYQAISFPCPERVQYKYRLLGYNDSWVSTSEGTVTYTNLKSGDYRFEVFACNENGYWNDKPTVLQFTIVPAYWQTWWFIGIILLIILSSGAITVYYFMKRKQNRDSKQREIEQKLISMQVNAINAQLDPHFVFNAISAIGTEVQQQNSEKAYTYFIKVSHLLRNSLKNADKITRTLKEELSFVENYLSLQKFRFDNRFDYIINVPPEMDMSRIIPKMCIQIFVENALKHGIEHLLSDGILTVTIWSDTRGFNAIIQDNGVGRAKSKQYNAHSTGVGLKVFTDFFAIMNKYNSKKAGFTIEDLLLDNGESGGTKVSLFIPEGYQFESL